MFVSDNRFTLFKSHLFFLPFYLLRHFLKIKLYDDIFKTDNTWILYFQGLPDSFKLIWANYKLPIRSVVAKYLQ